MAAITAGLALAAACGAPPAVTPDGAPDGPLDATPDGSVDASPDAAVDGAPTLLRLGGLGEAVAWFAPVPGATDGAKYTCTHEGSMTSRARLWRIAGDGTRTLGAEAEPAQCYDIVGLDATRAAVTFSPQFGLASPRVVIADFAAHTTVEVELPTPAGLGQVLDLQRLPGGILATGRSFLDATGMPSTEAMWQLDDAGAVVRTWIPRRPATVIESPPPVVLARIDGDRVVRVDLDTDAVIATDAVPFVPLRLEPRAGEVAVLGALGDDVAYAPLGSPVATVLVGVAPGSAAARVDWQGRLMVATAVDYQWIRLYRLDDAHFDGVDGASRRDPTFGLEGRARADLGLPCELANPDCNPPFTGFHRRHLTGIAFDRPDRLTISGDFYDVFPTMSVSMAAYYQLP